MPIGRWSRNLKSWSSSESRSVLTGPKPVARHAGELQLFGRPKDPPPLGRRRAHPPGTRGVLCRICRHGRPPTGTINSIPAGRDAERMHVRRRALGRCAAPQCVSQAGSQAARAGPARAGRAGRAGVRHCHFERAPLLGARGARGVRGPRGPPTPLRAHFGRQCNL